MLSGCAMSSMADHRVCDPEREVSLLGINCGEFVEGDDVRQDEPAQGCLSWCGEGESVQHSALPWVFRYI